MENKKEIIYLKKLVEENMDLVPKVITKYQKNEMSNEDLYQDCYENLIESIHRYHTLPRFKMRAYTRKRLVEKLNQFEKEKLQLNESVEQEKKLFLDWKLSILCANEEKKKKIQLEILMEQYLLSLCLTSRERDVLEYKFGLTDKTKASIEKIAKTYQVDPKRISVIMSKALRKVREDEGIIEFIPFTDSPTKIETKVKSKMKQ